MKSTEIQRSDDNSLVTGLAVLPAFLKRYGAFVLLGLAIGVLIFEILHTRAIAARHRLQDAWTQYAGAVTPSDFQNTVISAYHVPVLNAYSYVRIGDFYLRDLQLGAPKAGVAGVKVTAAQAEKAAAHAFHTVLRKYPKQRVAAALAEWGLGSLYETQHQWAKARVIYQRLASDKNGWSGNAFTRMARWRLKRLAAWRRAAEEASAKNVSAGGEGGRAAGKRAHGVGHMASPVRRAHSRQTAATVPSSKPTSTVTTPLPHKAAAPAASVSHASTTQPTAEKH